MHVKYLTVPDIWQVLIYSCFCIFKGRDQMLKAPNIVQMHIPFSQSRENKNEESTPRGKDRHRQEGREAKIELIPK